MEREHQVDVWYIFFVLSVLGNSSIVVFMGVFCSREQVNGFYPFGGTSRYMGFNSCHLRWQSNYLLIKCTAQIKSLKDAPLLHTPWVYTQILNLFMTNTNNKAISLLINSPL